MNSVEQKLLMQELKGRFLHYPSVINDYMLWAELSKVGWYIPGDVSYSQGQRCIQLLDPDAIKNVDNEPLINLTIKTHHITGTTDDLAVWKKHVRSGLLVLGRAMW